MDLPDIRISLHADARPSLGVHGAEEGHSLSRTNSMAWASFQVFFLIANGGKSTSFTLFEVKWNAV